MKDILSHLSDALHEMQAERGRAVLFNSSKGTIFQKELQDSFEKSYTLIGNIRQKLTEISGRGVSDKAFLHSVSRVFDNFETLDGCRKEILNLELNSTEIISRYSHHVISPLMDAMIMVALSDKNNDPTKISAFSYFLQLKEKAGRERALGTRGLASISFGNKEFIDRFKFLLSEQESFKRTFFAMADDRQKEIYNTIMQSDSMNYLAEIRDRFAQEKNNNQNNIFKDISPEHWFYLSSKKMDLMKKVEEELADELQRNDSLEDSSSPETMILVPRGREGISSEQRAFIEQLPFFLGLPEDIISDLLQHAQVREYKKGKLLFLEGEVSTRLYIILNGWVKLFKGTSSGDETVLQMLTSGDMIAESAVFLKTNYHVSAQVAKTSVILTVPAPIIREKIKRHNKLALKVLEGISKHSHTLIQEFENIRLKPATERVGWFLLKLLLEQGQIPDLIELPYDKSLIASYLDMKPETFSRSLKAFKNQGYEITKNSVIIPNVSALCGFCDEDLASTCKKHGTVDCVKFDCHLKDIDS